MKYKRIILAGGNGYLGSVLAGHFKNLSEEVIILSRKPKPIEDNIKTVIWDGKHADNSWVQYLNNADLLVNLCGKNVNCRYTQKNRKEIIDSRVIPTMLLGQEISKMEHPPKLWVNVTSATIYRHAEDHGQDEDTGEIGYSFSIDVCNKWEQAFFHYATPHTRKIALRMGIVLGRHDGVFPRLLNLVKCGMGGRQGDGQQYVSWIHEQDVARITKWLIDHEEISGIINGTAPEPVKNVDLMSSIRKTYGIPIGLPAPEWLLEMGAAIIGTETELILKSRWVLPKRLLDTGYSFLFSKVEHAVHDILSIRI